MNNKLLSIIIIVILIIIGLLLFKGRTVAPTNLEVIGEETGNMMPVPGSDVPDTEVIKEFSVNGIPFSFSPATITVNKGDTVKITFKNSNGVHDLKIDEFNAATRILKTGEEETITFVANKTGVFEYYCSVGNHRAMGMVGTLTVK